MFHHANEKHHPRIIWWCPDSLYFGASFVWVVPFCLVSVFVRLHLFFGVFGVAHKERPLFFLLHRTSTVCLQGRCGESSAGTQGEIYSNETTTMATTRNDYDRNKSMHLCCLFDALHNDDNDENKIMSSCLLLLLLLAVVLCEGRRFLAGTPYRVAGQVLQPQADGGAVVHLRRP